MSPRVVHKFWSVDDCPICNPPPPKKRYTVEELRGQATEWPRSGISGSPTEIVAAFLEHLERSEQ